MSDIVDEIDALIDEQLDAGEPRNGYDYGDPGYPKCGHCGRDWHGMAITSRMEQMRWQGAVDEDYRYPDDDSLVLCPGSEFIGPIRPLPRCDCARCRANRALLTPTVDTMIAAAAQIFGDYLLGASYRWRLPSDPLDPSGWRDIGFSSEGIRFTNESDLQIGWGSDTPPGYTVDEIQDLRIGFTASSGLNPYLRNLFVSPQVLVAEALQDVDLEALAADRSLASLDRGYALDFSAPDPDVAAAERFQRLIDAQTAQESSDDVEPEPSVVSAERAREPQDQPVWATRMDGRRRRR